MMTMATAVVSSLLTEATDDTDDGLMVHYQLVCCTNVEIQED